MVWFPLKTPLQEQIRVGAVEMLIENLRMILILMILYPSPSCCDRFCVCDILQQIVGCWWFLRFTRCCTRGGVIATKRPILEGSKLMQYFKLIYNGFMWCKYINLSIFEVICPYKCLQFGTWCHISWPLEELCIQPMICCCNMMWSLQENWEFGRRGPGSKTKGFEALKFTFVGGRIFLSSVF